MSHSHCSDHECTHRYAHADGDGPEDNLFPYIDHPNVVALNDSDADLPASRVCKSWSERNSINVVSRVTMVWHVMLLDRWRTVDSQ